MKKGFGVTVMSGYMYVVESFSCTDKTFGQPMDTGIHFGERAVGKRSTWIASKDKDNICGQGRNK